MAPNEAAMRLWIKENNPALPQHQIDSLMEHVGVFAMMAMAFEAGRAFQDRNPEIQLGPLDPSTTYK